MESRKEFSKNLLYFSNFEKIERVIKWFQGISWVVCIILNVSFVWTGNIMDYADHHTYLPLIGFSYIAPQIFAVCEAWANALMITLFNSLQFDDYNLWISDKKRSYLKQLKKQVVAGKKDVHNNPLIPGNSGSNNSVNMSMPLQKPILMSEMKKRQKKGEDETLSWESFTTCVCCRNLLSKRKK